MRLLLVQFKSDLLTSQEDQKAKAYYDKLYRTRAGYNRFGPVWEIPQWIGEMKRNFPDADVLFAGSIAEAYYGGVPTEIADETLARLDSRLMRIYQEFQIRQ